MKESRTYNRTTKAEKTQHAPNLAHCGALEREGNQAKEPINVHNAHRPPKTPHIKRKPMRTSKHTAKETNAPHGQKMRPSRQRRRGRARAKQQRTGCNERRHALPTQHRHGSGSGTADAIHASHAPRHSWRGTRTRRACRSYEKNRFPYPFFLSLGLIYILYFLCFFLSFLAAIVRKHFFRFFRKKYEMQLQPKYIIPQYTI